MLIKFSEKEINHLLRVIEFFSDCNSDIDKEILGEIMIIYWRIHRMKTELTSET